MFNKLDNKNFFTFPPGTRILETLANSGYSIETAIADIIDNSIAALATEVKISFNVSNNKFQIIISDNGYGMDLETLKNAIRLSHRSTKDIREETDLGRFSIGLKSASVSFCNKLIVVSKSKKDQIHNVIVDFKNIIESENWVAQLDDKIYLSEYPIEKNGTHVIWEDLKIFDNLVNSYESSANDAISLRQKEDYFYTKAESVEKHISKVFNEYIEKKKIKIFIQDNVIKGWDPFFRQHLNTRIFNGNHELKFKNKKVVVNTYILPVFEKLNNTEKEYIMGKGLTEQQGFYLYRNDRLIVEGSWFDLPGIKRENKNNYARIKVDIPIDFDEEFSINFAKNTAVIPEALKNEFIKIAKDAKKEANKNFEYTRNPRPSKNKNNEIQIWEVNQNNKQIIVNLNENHPVIAQCLRNVSIRDKKKLLNLISKSIPINQIQSLNVRSEDFFTEKDMETLIVDEIKRLMKLGESLDHIESTLLIQEPFSRYKSILMEYIRKFKEVKDND